MCVCVCVAQKYLKKKGVHSTPVLSYDKDLENRGAYTIISLWSIPIKPFVTPFMAIFTC